MKTRETQSKETKLSITQNVVTEQAKGRCAQAPGSATARNLAWAERELLKMQDEETDPQLRALWSTAARIARERIAAKSPNDRTERRGTATLENHKPL